MEKNVINIDINMAESFDSRMLEKSFLIDSGASVSLTNDQSILHNYQEIITPITIADGQVVISRGKGSLLFDGHYLPCVYFPNSSDNIISTRQLHEVGFGVFSTKTHMILLKVKAIPTTLVNELLQFISKEATNKFTICR